ncbi:MAG: hypothetical protein Q7R65_04660 [bacterium]|nr:hypothetical protein [bacterium]
MKIFISFNWPVGIPEPSFQASIGIIGVDEKDLRFQLGVIKKGKPDLVHWCTKGPVSAEIAESKDFNIRGQKGDRLVVETSDQGRQIKRQIKIDSDREWPTEAFGGTTVDWSRTY